MARSIWAELQREHARRERLQQQACRAAVQAAAREARQRDQAMRAAARQAAASERERKQLYVADRKAEAAAMTSELRTRSAELDSVLAAGTGRWPGLSFASLKHTLSLPGFDPGGLGTPIAEPQWEQFAPRPPGTLGKMLGGGARFRAGAGCGARSLRWRTREVSRR